jgi:hypothetical protein
MKSAVLHTFAGSYQAALFQKESSYSNYFHLQPVVLYECETWSLTLREEHRLWMFENRVLRRIFGP